MADWAGNDTGSANDVNSSPGADVGSSSASGSSSGSAGWWSSEIAGREADARANTQSNPTNPSPSLIDPSLPGAAAANMMMSAVAEARSGPSTYTYQRTGEVFANQQIAYDLGRTPLLTAGGRTDPYAQGLAAQTTPADQARYMQRNDDPYAGAKIGIPSGVSQPDASAQYLNRQDIYAVTDRAQLVLMATGMTQYQAAESLRVQAQNMGNRSQERYYDTLGMQAWTSQTGKSAAYHTWSADTNLPQKANPYEYSADLLTYVMKGYPTQDKEKFSPVNYEVLNLAGGKGQQAYVWTNDKYDLRFAMDVVAQVEKSGDLGPYGQLKSYSSGYGYLDIGFQQGIAAKVDAGRAIPEGVSWSVWGATQDKGIFIPSVQQNTAKASVAQPNPTYGGVTFTSIALLGKGVAPVSPSQVAASMEAAGYPITSVSSSVMSDRVGITPTSPMGVEVGMAEGSIPKPFVSGGMGAAIGLTPNEQIESNLFSNAKVAALGMVPVFGPALLMYTGIQSERARETEANKAIVAAGPYEIRNDATAYALEIPLIAGDVIASKVPTYNGGMDVRFGEWQPGAALLTAYGQNENAKLSETLAEQKSIESRLPGITKAIEQSKQQDTVMAAYLVGKVNTAGEFSGTASEFETYKTMVSERNKNVGIVNAYDSDVKAFQQKAYSEGVFLPKGNEYIINPDLTGKYGAASRVSTQFAQVVDKALLGKDMNAEKWNAFEQSPAFKNAPNYIPESTINTAALVGYTFPVVGVATGFVTTKIVAPIANTVLSPQYGEGLYRTITNPETGLKTATEGLLLYTVMSGAGELAASRLPAAGTVYSPISTEARIATAWQSPLLQGSIGAAFIGKSVYDIEANPQLSTAEKKQQYGGLTSSLYIMGMGAVYPEAFSSGVGYSSVRFDVKPETRVTATVVESGNVLPSHAGGEQQINYNVDYTVSQLPQYNIFGKTISFPRLSNLVEIERGTIKTPQPVVIENAQSFGISRDPNVGIVTPAIFSRESAITIDYFKGESLGRGNTQTNINALVANRGVETFYNEAIVESKANPPVAGYPRTQHILDIARDRATEDIALAEPRVAYRNYDLYVSRDIGVPQTISEMLKVPIRGDIVETTYNLGVVSPFDFINRVQVSRSGTNLRENYMTSVDRISTTEAIRSTDMTDMRAIVNDLQRRSMGTAPRATEFATAYDAYGNLIGYREGTTGSVYPVDTYRHTNVGQEVSTAHYHPNVPFSFREFGNAIGSDIWQVLTMEKQSRRLHPTSTQTEAYLISKSRGGMYYETPSVGDLRNSAGESPLLKAEYIANREGVFIYEKPVGTYGWDLIPSVTDIRNEAVFDYYIEGNRQPLRTAGVDTISAIEATGSRTQYIPNERIFLTGEETTTITGDVSARMRGDLPEFMRTGITEAADRMVLGNYLLEFDKGVPASPIKEGYSGGIGIGKANANTIYGSAVATEMQRTPINPRGFQEIAPMGAETRKTGETKAFSIGTDIQPSGMTNPVVTRSAIAIPFVQSQQRIQITEPLLSYQIKSELQLKSEQMQVRKQEQIPAYLIGSDIQTESVQKSDTLKISSVMQISALSSISALDRLSIYDQQQMPMQKTGQIQQQIPIVDQIKEQVPIGKIPPPPIPIIPLLPKLPPFFGGGGGSGGGMRPRGPRHTEIFSYAPKNLKGLYGMPKGRTPAIKKQRK